jgi:integrase
MPSCSATRRSRPFGPTRTARAPGAGARTTQCINRKGRKIIAATRVSHYQRIGWSELPQLLQALDQFERSHRASRCSLIALRLMMPTLVRPSEIRAKPVGAKLLPKRVSGSFPLNA